jgi:hypothetical protein
VAATNRSPTSLAFALNSAGRGTINPMRNFLAATRNNSMRCSVPLEFWIYLALTLNLALALAINL